MSKPDQILSMLGLSAKAGKLVSGETATELAIKNLEAWLVVIAVDASANTRKHFTDMCSYREIPFIEYGTKEELGRAIGKDYRSNMAVTDRGLAKAIQEKL